MTLFSQIIQYTISGITSGSIYAVIGICWSVVYLITKVLNFTTGEFLMLGGMLTWGFHGAGLGIFPASLLAVAGTVCIAIVMERIAIRSVRYPSEMTYMMLTIAAASVIKGIVLLIWGSETRIIDPFFGTEAIHLFGATLTSQVLCVLALLVIATVGLSLFLNCTLLGKALRASSINLTGASLMGIDISRFKIRSDIRDNLEKIKGFVGQNGIFNYTPDNHNGLGAKMLCAGCSGERQVDTL